MAHDNTQPCLLYKGSQAPSYLVSRFPHNNINATLRRAWLGKKIQAPHPLNKLFLLSRCLRGPACVPRSLIIMLI